MNAKHLSIDFESLLPYGVLVIDSGWHLHKINPAGIQLCQKLHALQTTPACSPNQQIPLPIQKSCQRFVEICANHPQQSPAWQEELALSPEMHLKVCVQWLETADSSLGLMLVIIENLATTAKRQARCDALRYGLTRREEEYWALACQGFSQPEIKQLMFISINTVKKHARSVNFKRNI